MSEGDLIVQARLMVSMLKGEIDALPAAQRVEVNKWASGIRVFAQGEAGRRALALVAAQAELYELVSRQPSQRLDAEQHAELGALEMQNTTQAENPL